MKRGRLVKLLVILLVFMISGLPGTVAENADLGSISEAVLEAPNLIIADDRWMPVFKAGEKVSLNVPIENTTSGTAKNVRVSLVVNDVDKFPFKSDKMTFTRNVSSMSAGTSGVSFNLIVPANVKPGVYPVTVSVSYDSDYGGGGQTTGTLYIEIANDYRQPDLKLMNVRLPEERLPAGKSNLVTLVINNEGDLPVKDVEVSLTGFNGGLTLDNWSDTQNLGQMKANEIKPVSYRIHVDPETKNGTYILDLNIAYKDDYDQEYKKASKVYLPVAGKGSQDDLTPRIIIDNYNYGSGDHVTAGETFALNLYLSNTSEQTAVKNIKISLNSDGQVFAPVGSGNTLFIREIGPGHQVEASINLRPKESAEPQTFTVTAEIDYQDTEGNKYTEKEIISIPVTQTINLLISEAIIPPQTFSGNPANVSVDFHNTGRAVIRNLRIHTVGDFETRDGEIFLGTLDPGKSEYYDVSLVPNKTGNLTGTIMFEYEDNAGQHYQIAKEFKLLVQEPIPMSLPGGPQPSVEEQNKFTFKWWMIPMILAFAGSVGFVIYRKKKKAKEALFLDD